MAILDSGNRIATQTSGMVLHPLITYKKYYLWATYGWQLDYNSYHVIEKDGNAIVIQDAHGQTKMRNVGQMKKFVEADPVVVSGGDRYLALRRARLSIILVTRRSQRLS